MSLKNSTCSHGVHFTKPCLACEEPFSSAALQAIPQSTLDQTLAERGARYGDFTHYAAISQGLQDHMRDTIGWNGLSDVQKQSLTVISDKIARILTGDPNYKDNWHDIQGYAKLAEDRCI